MRLSIAADKASLDRGKAALALLIACTLAGAASAADSPAAPPNAPGETLEEVVVTGSLLETDGARAPTPVTVATMEELQVAAPRTMTEALIQLPVFKGSVSVQSQGTGTTTNVAGAYLNLRGLGAQRTLVLLDGRRVVSATSAGSVDAALLPEALVSQVEIVTGGASAAYGSDAVAGVVNYRLNTHYEGLKGTVQFGESTHNDARNYKVALAGGTSAMDGRLHVVGSIEHYDNNGVETNDRRDWAYRGIGAITNPNVTAANPASATNPRQLVVVNPFSSVAAPGGLVTNTALAGTTFLPGGTPTAFQYGTLRTATLMAGGASWNPSLKLVLQPAQARTAGFGHVAFDVNDRFSVFAEVNLGRNAVVFNSLPTFELSATAFTIFADNAFLPASVAARMNDPTAPIPSMTVGRVSADIAIPRLVGETRLKRYVGGFEGSFGETWKYKAYYQHGESHALFKTTDDPISDNLYRAVDAVRVNGLVTCRSTIADPTNGCVPLNIFGDGSPSAASRAWIVGTAVQDVTVKQDVVEAAVTGEPLALPGGPLGVAFGAGWRKEDFVQTTDPVSQRIRTGNGIQGYPAGLRNTLGGFERTNPQPSQGNYSVKEAFAEVNLPLLTDAGFAKSLTANAAARYTDYSLSGGVTTWKGGLVWEPIAGLRFRGTHSRDIRSPTLGELYQGSSQGTATIVDPVKQFTGTALTGNIGNTALTPEVANTNVFGIVLQPSFMPGFIFSVDYYDIDIKEAISTLSAQQIVTLCAGGATSLCGFVQRDTLWFVSRVRIPFVNVAARKTSGLDIEVGYDIPMQNVLGLGEGGLTFRLLANNLQKFDTQVQGAAVLHLAGDVGVNSTPKWTGVFVATANAGKFGLSLQERYIGSGKYDNTLTAIDIDRNHAASITYTDLTLTYDVGGSAGLQGFVTVNNLFDRDPVMTPGILISGSSLGNRALYDILGRSVTVGTRFKF